MAWAKRVLATSLIPSKAGRMLRFGAVGGFGFLLNATVLLLLVEGVGWSYWLSAIVAIELSTISNYLMNRFWTWRDRDVGTISLLHYHAVVALGVVTQFTVLVSLVEVTGVHYLVGSVAGVAAGTVLNYAGHDLMTFGRHHRAAKYVLAAMAYIAVAAILSHPWDTFVFERTTEDFVRSGTTPYQTVQDDPAYIYLGHWVPPLQQWYAYPPLPLIMMALTAGPGFLLDAPVVITRILVKLPAILGALGVAAVSHHLLISRDGDPARARRAENWLLWAPAGFIVAGVWGQFEPLMVLFILLSILAIRREHWALAGLAFGAAVLVKIFPLYVAPALALYAWRRGGARSVMKAASAAAVLFMVVSFPFWLMAPQGYLEQLVGMHSGRPPARFSPLMVVHRTAAWLPGIFGLSSPGLVALIRPISILSFGLTAAVAGLLLAGDRSRDERGLIALLALTFGATLLTTKVLNEQYLYIPFVLFTLVWMQAGYQGWAGQIARWLGIGIAVMALVANLGLLRFLVPELSHILLPDGSFSFALTRIAAVVGLSAPVLQVASYILAVVAVAPALWYFIRESAPAFRAGFLVLETRLRVPATTQRAAIASFCVLVLFTPMIMASYAPAVHEDPAASVPEESWVWLRTDHRNPSNDPLRPLGTWRGIDSPSELGYYSTSGYTLDRATNQIRGAGLGAVIVGVAPDSLALSRSAYQLSAEKGLKVTWGLDVTLLIGDHDVPMSLETAEAVAEWVRLTARDSADTIFIRGWEAVGTRPTQGQLDFVDYAVSRQAPELALSLASGRVPAGSPLWDHAQAIAAEVWLDIAGAGLDVKWVGRDLPAVSVGPDPALALISLAMVSPERLHVLPWNDPGGWGAIEPSQHHGAVVLEIVKAWVATGRAADSTGGMSPIPPVIADQEGFGPDAPSRDDETRDDYELPPVDQAAVS